MPTLFVYGQEDRAYMVEDSHQLFSASPAPTKELWGVPGAKHAKGYRTVPEEYMTHIVEFLGKTLGPTP